MLAGPKQVKNIETKVPHLSEPNYRITKQSLFKFLLSFAKSTILEKLYYTLLKYFKALNFVNQHSFYLISNDILNKKILL